MAQNPVAAELAALRAELDRAAAASSPPAASRAEPDAAEHEQSEGQLQIERLLQELQSVLSGAAGGAEELIAEHPLPSVSAAFLLGLAVGWAASRS